MARVDEDLFIGVYGGECAPEDFLEFITKAALDTSKPLIEAGVEWGKEAWWKGALVALGMVAYFGLMVASALIPGGLQMFATQFLRAWEETGALRYFGFTKGEELVIDIPILESALLGGDQTSGRGPTLAVPVVRNVARGPNRLRHNA